MTDKSSAFGLTGGACGLIVNLEPITTEDLGDSRSLGSTKKS